MEVAVLILTHGRVELLKKCLKSITDQQTHPFKLNFHILVNGPDSETVSWLKESGIPYIASTKSIPVGEARNLLLEQISEEYVCFLDDDIILPQDYFAKVGSFIKERPQIDIFGGPDQNTPDSTNFQKCLGLVMESFLATGPTSKRHKTSDDAAELGDEVNLILCNFWAKREVFKQQMFPKHFRRNEENYLLSILKDKNVAMCRLPSLFVYHNRKSSMAKLVRVLFLAGIYRSVSIVIYPSSFRLIFLINQLFVATFVTLAMVELKFFYILSALYLLIIGVNSLLIAAKTKSVLNIPRAMVLFIIFNFVYPVGQLLGYFKGAFALLRGQKF
ncbi:MAG: glycosyltransferase family 2 protein [Bacteriovoracaceae bacterium]|nr:glycosyltransferase family 2 protein [Bacteriovoracaceae bacterium]